MVVTGGSSAGDFLRLLGNGKAFGLKHLNYAYQEGEGGIVQALGQGLMEDYKLDGGRTSTSGFAKYILPTSLDVPRINSIIIEDPDPIGPLGVKGVGEPAMVPTIPAVMNAIYDAVGVRITSLPATPEKVLMAIREKERSEAMQAAE